MGVRGALAAAKLAIPCVVHGIGSAANVEEVLALANDRLRELAASAGLEGRDWLTQTTYLDPCPPCLQVDSWSFAPTRSRRSGSSPSMPPTVPSIHHPGCGTSVTGQ